MSTVVHTILSWRSSGARGVRDRMLLGFGAVFLVAAMLLPEAGYAQDRTMPQRQVRTYIPPDQIVSIPPSTSFDQFVSFINPIVQRVTGRQIVDPESRTQPIGIAVAGMQFFDAFELVLEFNGLTYRETDRFFILEPAPKEPMLTLQTTGTLVPSTNEATAAAALAAKEVGTPRSREVQINALLFEMNLTKARQTGIDWNVLFGEQTGQSGGGRGGSGGGAGQETPVFYLRTDEIFDQFDDYLVAPDRIEVGFITRLVRLLESNGVGRTLANPSVTVRSGEQGRIQIGSDIPVTVRDFAGNTITQFVSTGIIINVVPTLVENAPIDSVGGRMMDFINLDVQVERSNARPFGSGVAIDRSTATTEVFLLNGEQTIIGGLYSTDETVSRRGIPVLKDLPPWFFGLRYLFGTTQRVDTERELVIVLQARAVDALPDRLNRPQPNQLLEQFRRRTKQQVGILGDDVLREMGPSEQPLKD